MVQALVTAFKRGLALAMVFLSHARDAIGKLCGRIAVVQHGQIVEAAAPVPHTIRRLA